jgi:hypothetical protein
MEEARTGSAFTTKDIPGVYFVFYGKPSKKLDLQRDVPVPKKIPPVCS